MSAAVTSARYHPRWHSQLGIRAPVFSAVSHHHSSSKAGTPPPLSSLSFKVQTSTRWDTQALCALFYKLCTLFIILVSFHSTKPQTKFAEKVLWRALAEPQVRPQHPLAPHSFRTSSGASCQAPKAVCEHHELLRFVNLCKSTNCKTCRYQTPWNFPELQKNLSICHDFICCISQLHNVTDDGSLLSLQGNRKRNTRWWKLKGYKRNILTNSRDNVMNLYIWSPLS